MPIIEVHLVEGHHTPGQHAAVLRALSERCAEVLELPTEQVRAHLNLHRPEHSAFGGRTGAARSAPYFTALVSADRPAAQRRRVLEGCTDLLVDLLGVDRKLVWGRIARVHPEDWAVGGVPAGRAGVGDAPDR